MADGMHKVENIFPIAYITHLFTGLLMQVHGLFGVVITSIVSSFVQSEEAVSFIYHFLRERMNC